MLNRLYSYFFNKANVLRSEISKKEGESPWRVKTFAALYLFTIEMMEDFFKLLILLFKNPYDSFQLFTKQETLPICEYSYTDHRRFQKKVRLFSLAGLSSIISATIIINLILSLVLPGQLPSYAKTVNGGWDDWSLTNLAGDPPAGSAGTLTMDPANSSEISGTGTASTLALKSNSSTATDDGTFSTTGSATGGTFASGTISNTAVSGSGAGASVGLGYNIAGGTGADGALDLSSGCSGTGLSWSSPTCTINTTTKSTFNFTTINIPSGTTLTATGSVVSGLTGASLTIKATGNVTVAGTINLSGQDLSSSTGSGGAGGAGGYSGGNGSSCPAAQGFGPGGGFAGCNWWGGGGGGFGGAGGHAGTVGGAGGSTYNTENVGGSGGGGEISGGGGGGGGSLKIITAGQLSINSGSLIKANGGNITYPGYGGGGSGGRIILIASIISNSGLIEANGGNGNRNSSGYYTTGASGGGGGGRITLQDNDGVVSGTISVIGGEGENYGSSGITTISATPYQSSGTFESATIDLGGKANFSTLAFASTIPLQTQSSCITNTGAGCALKLQIAANNDNATWSYVGPDGTVSTYFTFTGEAINSAQNGSRYLRYKAYLSTADIVYTPTLDSLTINYSQYPSSISTVTNLIFNTSQTGNPVWGSVSWVRSDSNTASAVIKVKAQARVAGNSTALASAAFAGYDGASTASAVYFDKSNANCSETAGKWGDTSGDNATKKTVTCSIDSLDTTYFNPTATGNQWLELKLILEGDSASTPVIDAARATYSINGQPEACEVYNTQTSTCTTQASASLSTSSSNYGYITFNSGIKDLDTNTGTLSPGKVLVALEYATSGSFNQATPPGFLDSYYSASNRFASTYTLTGTGLACVPSTDSSVVALVNPQTDTNTWKFVCDLNTTDPVPFIPLTASWNAKQDINNTYFANFKMRLLVSDQEGANSVGSGETAAFTVDTANPTGSIIIDATDKASTNNSNITLSCNDDTTAINSQYALSDDGATWDNWNNIVCNGQSTSIRRTLTENATTRTTTVHYKYRDAYGNESASASKTTGQRPHNLILQDVSNVLATPPSYKNFLSWEVVSAPANGFNSYLVYRCAPTESDPSCANNANYAIVTTKTSISDNSYVDSDVTADGTYYYHIATKDNGNHLSKWSNPDTGAANPVYGKANGTQDLGEGGGGSDTTAPVISSVNIPQDQITQNSAVINFTTSETANGGAFYGVSTYGNEKSSLTYSTDHSLTLTGLSSNTTYKVRLISSDASGNDTTCDETNLNTANCSISSASQLAFTTTSVDTTAPSISGVAVSNLSSSGATVTFQTNESADTCISYRQGSETEYASEQCNSSLTTNHLLILGSLSSNTTYYLKIKSRDANQNLASNCFVNNDNASLTNTDCSSLSDAATLTFTTTSPTAAGGGGGGGGGGGKTDFDAPKISDVKVENITHDSATITWLTNENSSSLVQYGTDSDSLRDASGQVDSVITHKVILKNLKESTKYFFSPTSIDSAGNIGSPSAQSFTTLKAPTVAEEISKLSTPEAQERTKEVLKSLEEQIKAQKENIVDPLQTLLDALSPLVPEPIIIGESPEIEVTSTTAIVKWRTDKKSTSFVALSREDEYDAKSLEPYKQVVGNPEDSVKEHTVEVSGLLPGTKYHYQVRSKALLGETSQSRDFSFTTKSELPQIVKFLQKKTDDEKTATVYWETSVPTDSVVKYTPYVKGKLDPKLAKIQGKPDLVSDHEITISNLDSGTVYQIEVSGRDPFGNITSKILPDFTTAIDKDAPVIAQVRIESAMISGKVPKIQTIVSYRTDEPATTQVFYAEGGSDKFKQLPEDPSFTSIHTSVITEFKPASIYRIRTVSKDQSGNEATSRDYTILTPAQSESIIDIIIKTFENTFGWVKNIRF